MYSWLAYREILREKRSPGYVVEAVGIALCLELLVVVTGSLNGSLS